MSIRLVYITNLKTNRILCCFNDEESDKEMESLSKKMQVKIIKENKDMGSSTYNNKLAFFWKNNGKRLFLGVTDKSFNSKVGFDFIFKIEELFNKKFTNEDYLNKCYHFSLNNQFNEVISKEANYFSMNQDDRNDRNLDELKDSLIETKNLLIENEEKINERQNILEHISDKANTLKEDTFVFVANTKAVKKSIYNDKIKIKKVLFVLILVFLFYFICCIICGGFFLPNCLF